MKSEYNKKYYQENREKLLIQKHDWYKQNQEKVKQYNKGYYEENKDKFKEHSKKYYRENREKVLKRQKEWAKNNPEKIQEYHKKRKDYFTQYNKKWAESHKEERKIYARNRTKETLNLWKQIIKELGYEIKCKTCGYDKNFSVLEFHHRNPGKKDFLFSTFLKLIPIPERIDLLKEEIQKCDILCSNCHQEIHFPL